MERCEYGIKSYSSCALVSIYSARQRARCRVSKAGKGGGYFLQLCWREGVFLTWWAIVAHCPTVENAHQELFTYICARTSAHLELQLCCFLTAIKIMDYH